ncbi:polycystin family member [Anaeramoeba ignava]|uniref:Polycystin family member n=1 Tax=Anaeramoeba ignava TaxID=1746090 RepID=A0A9Q0LPQ9_ANAIG|nr:polycystin family member [Anaeramoeba ignava]
MTEKTIFHDLMPNSPTANLSIPWLNDTGNIQEVTTSDSEKKPDIEENEEDQNKEQDEINENDFIDMKIILKQCKRRVEKKVLLNELKGYLVFLIVFMMFLSALRDVTLSWESNFGMTDLFLDEEFPPSDTEIKKTFWDVGSYKKRIIKIGAIRFRLLRVTSGSCKIPSQYEDFAGKTCYREYKNSRKATEPFGPSNIWQYSSASTLKTTSELGRSGRSYEGGGYAVDFPKGTNNTAAIDYLQNNDFLDKSSRALFVHIHLYNINSNQFMALVPLFEITAGGLVIPSVSIRAFRLDLYLTAIDYYRGVLEVIIVLFVIYYTISTVRDVVKTYFNRGNPLLYFFNIWNLVDFVNLVLFWALIIMHISYLVEVNKTNADLDSNDFVPLSILAKKYMMFMSVISFNVFLTWFKIFKFLRLNKRMLLLWDTLSDAAPDITIFLTFFLIVFIAFATMGFVLFGPVIDTFRDFSQSIITCFQMALGDLSLDDLRLGNRFLGPIKKEESLEDVSEVLKSEYESLQQSLGKLEERVNQLTSDNNNDNNNNNNDNNNNNNNNNDNNNDNNN